MKVSKMSIGGLTITFSDGTLTIKGLDKPKTSEEKVVIDKDGNINGDVVGNIEIKGEKVTLVVKGDVIGNITGDGHIKVEGDVTGDIIRDRMRD